MKIRTMAAVFAAKSAGFICRKMGRQGVTWAGKIALKINPDILEDLSSQVRKKRQPPTTCSAQPLKMKGRK